MTDRQSAPFKFRLPAPTSITEETVCYEVELPNEPLILEAFEGAVHLISNWTYWTKDQLQSAVKASNVFKALYQRLIAMPCVRCSPNNPPMSPGLEPGQTKTFRIVVEAGEFNLLPIVLKANQSLTLTDWMGQWRDSQYHPEVPCSSNWETPDGFIIGSTGGATADIFPTDALPEYPHMALAMRVSNCGILTYHELNDPVTFTVPASVDENGVFVEFFGNCPLDANGEIAPGFLGYGMICLKAIVSDPNLCGQVFINFSEPFDFTLIEGTIVDPSPIGEGPALRSDAVGPTTATATIEIELPECTIRDFAFSWNVHQVGTVNSFSIAWTIRDSEGTLLQSGAENIPWVQDTTGNMTIAVEQPDAATIRLLWNANLSPQFDSSEFWIDNVFIN